MPKLAVNAPAIASPALLTLIPSNPNRPRAVKNWATPAVAFCAEPGCTIAANCDGFLNNSMSHHVPLNPLGKSSDGRGPPDTVLTLLQLVAASIAADSSVSDSATCCHSGPGPGSPCLLTLIARVSGLHHPMYFFFFSSSGPQGTQALSLQQQGDFPHPSHGCPSSSG